MWFAENAPLQPIKTIPKAFWRVHSNITFVFENVFLVDLFGPLEESESGNKYVFLGVCGLTKYVEGSGNIVELTLLG